MTAAFDYVRIAHPMSKHSLYPGDPVFIFRGEPGEYPTTTPSIARVTGLSPSDVLKLADISDRLAAQLQKEREEMTKEQASGLLQHYGMPSCFVDFTGDLGLAFSFAGATENCEIGRVAVLPFLPGRVYRFYDHPWAERAQRQAAFGVLMDPHEINDLKADAVRELLSIRWYEFKSLPDERTFCRQGRDKLLRDSDDPSAGFVRYYVTLYVEEFGKLSPKLTNWLLASIVVAPYCALVTAHEQKNAVVRFRGSDCLPSFTRDVEIEWSRRYWSKEYPHDSRDRLRNFRMPLPGQIYVDPRTYHADCALTVAV